MQIPESPAVPTERKPTVNNVMVVTGSVTSKQYQEARNSLLRQGLKPKVVRVSHGNILSDEFETAQKRVSAELKELEVNFDDIALVVFNSQDGDLVVQRINALFGAHMRLHDTALELSRS